MEMIEPDYVLICASLLMMRPRNAMQIAKIMGVTHTEACTLMDQACKEHKLQLRVHGASCTPAYHPCLPLTWDKQKKD